MNIRFVCCLILMSSLFLSPFAWAQSIATSERQELLRTVHPVVAMSSIHRSIAHSHKLESLNLDHMIQMNLKKPTIVIKYGKLHITSTESQFEFVVDVVGRYFRVLNLNCRPNYNNDCFTDKNLQPNPRSHDNPEKSHFVFQSSDEEERLVNNFRRTTQQNIHQLSESEWGRLKVLATTSASMDRVEILKRIKWDELSLVEQKFIKDYVSQCFNDHELETLISLADTSGDLSWLVTFIKVSRDINDPHYHSSISLRDTFKEVFHHLAEKFEHEYYDFTLRAREYLQTASFPQFLKLDAKEIMNFIGVEKRVETLFLKKFTEHLRVGKVKDDIYMRLSVFSDYTRLTEDSKKIVSDWITFSTDTSHFSVFLEFIERNLSQHVLKLLEQIEFKLVVMELNNPKNNFNELHRRIKKIRASAKALDSGDKVTSQSTIGFEQFLSYLSGKPVASGACSIPFE